MFVFWSLLQSDICICFLFTVLLHVVWLLFSDISNLLCMDESSKYSNRQDIKTVNRLFGLNQSFRILFIKSKTGIMKNCGWFVLLVEASKKMLTKPKTEQKNCIDFRSGWSSRIVASEAFFRILLFYTFWFLLEGYFFLRNHNPAKHSCSICNPAT